jgi:ABC-type branched-subunit amino acid transport system ATPase component
LTTVSLPAIIRIFDRKSKLGFAMTMLEIQNVHTYYGNIHALKDISLNIDQGENLGAPKLIATPALFACPGCQNSTLGRIIAEVLDELGDRNKLDSIHQALIKVLKNSDTAIALGAFDNVDMDVATKKGIPVFFYAR